MNGGEPPRDDVMKNVRFTGTWSEPEPLDPDKDQLAWKTAEESLEPRFHRRFDEPPEPTETASAVAQERASAFGLERKFSAADLKLAAAITAHVSGLFSGVDPLGPSNWSIIVAALNAYPHPESTAVRLLKPALRNLVGQARETPEELWRG